MWHSATHIKVIELTYALPPISLMDFNEIPVMVSTPTINLIEPLPTKSCMSTKLERAAMIAQRFGEPEPDMLSYDLWLNKEFLVCTTDWGAMHWSCECQEAIASELKHMDNQGKLKIEGYVCPSSKWVGDRL